MKTGCRDTETNGCDSVTRWLYGERQPQPGATYLQVQVFWSLREEDCCEFEASLSYTDLNHWASNKLCNYSLGVRSGTVARSCLGSGKGYVILNLALLSP